MKNLYQEIKKMPGDRLIELAKSLQIVRDSIDMFKQGKSYQIAPLCGQLRALLTDKSNGNKPLLIDLSEQLNKTLSVFAMPDTTESSFPFKDQASFYMTGFPFTRHKENIHQKEISLTDFLEKKLIYFNNANHSINKIIKFYANKAGGAHYSPSIPIDFHGMLQMGDILDKAIVQIGEAVLDIGTGFLQMLTSLEWHVLFFIPEQQVNKEAFILDNKHSGSPMRFYLALNKGKKLVFGITTLDNISIEVPINRLVDLKHPTQFAAKISLESDLCTKVSLLINGAILAETKLSFPVLIAPKMDEYEKYINRPYDQQGQSLEIGFIDIRIFDRQLTPTESAQNYISIEDHRNRAEIQFMDYPSNSYGYSPVGKKDFENTGDVRIKRISALEFQESLTTE